MHRKGRLFPVQHNSKKMKKNENFENFEKIEKKVLMYLFLNAIPLKPLFLGRMNKAFTNDFSKSCVSQKIG